MSSSTTAWLFSARTDVLVFAGSAIASAALAIGAAVLGVGADTPPWAWLVLVVGVDVAHVWSTLFRVYLDPEERSRRPLLYAAAPVVAYALGVVAHAVSSGFFWSALAYVAVWHFVRQQVGWMTLYGRRSRSAERDVRFDRLTMYAATLGPVVWWHANLPRPFWWFREGDFLSGLPHVVGDLALALHGLVLLSWLGWQLVGWARGTGPHPGKVALVAATWLCWFGGIVVARSDFAFTVMNVVLHGVPYLVLLYGYARRREAEGGYGAWRFVIRAGVPAFMGLLLCLAFTEEYAWDTLVWHEHPMFFGAHGLDLSDGALGLLVPLLALPQTTHYLLDGFVWRTRDDPSLARRLGWAPAG